MNKNALILSLVVLAAGSALARPAAHPMLSVPRVRDARPWPWPTVRRQKLPRIYSYGIFDDLVDQELNQPGRGNRRFAPLPESSLLPPESLMLPSAAPTRASDAQADSRSVGLIIFAPPPNYGHGVLPSKVGDLSYNETTGIINIPAARVAPAGSTQLSIEFQDATLPGVGLYTSSSEGPRPFDLGNFAFQNAGDYHLVVGIGHNIELSYMNLHFGINDPIFGVKWLAVPDADDHPAFALGVQSIGLKAQGNGTSAYGYVHPASFDHPDLFGVVGHTWAFNDDGMSLEVEGGIGTARLKDGFIGGEFHFCKWAGVAGEWDGTIGSAALKFFPSDRFEIWLDSQYQNPPVRLGASLRYRMGHVKPRGSNPYVQNTEEHKKDPDDDDDDDAMRFVPHGFDALAGRPAALPVQAEAGAANVGKLTP